MTRHRPQLIYIHDPMCSWCWGFRPALTALQDLLPPKLTLNRLLGGLAPDTDQAMPTPMQHQLQATWRRIQRRVPGTRFNFDFWTRCQPRRSTWPACRAVIAARTLDPDTESPMIEAIQRAYYLQARNPSDDTTLVALARELGLDDERFADLLNADQTQHALDQEMAQARALGASSFPSLRLRSGDTLWPIAVDYSDASAMRDAIEQLLTA